MSSEASASAHLTERNTESSTDARRSYFPSQGGGSSKQSTSPTVEDPSTYQNLLDNDQAIDTNTEDGSATPQPGRRREGFNWGTATQLEGPGRSPLPPEQSKVGTPPPMEDILRGQMEESTAVSRTSTIYPSGSSSPGGTLSRTDTRTSSIAALAKGIARRVPDMRMFTSSRNDSGSYVADYSSNDMVDRNLFPFPSPIQPSLPSRQPVESARPRIKRTTSRTTAQQQPKAGLRDRRQAALELSLPIHAEADVIAPRHSPASAFSSITTSRPRSPRTPWVRAELWEPSQRHPASPILEEDIPGTVVITNGPANLLPDMRKISSAHSPQEVATSPRTRNRWFDAFPRFRSRRSNRSEQSSDIEMITVDNFPRPSRAEGLQVEHMRHREELQQLARTSRTARSRRWYWRRSSDSTTSSPEPASRRLSLMGSNSQRRVSEQSCRSQHEQQKRPSTNLRPHTFPLAGYAVPPIFVPPGCERVDTSPELDVNDELHDKLGAFVFDVHDAPGTPRPDRKLSAGGHWDSDILLMSLPKDLELQPDEEEIGPEATPRNMREQACMQLDDSQRTYPSLTGSKKPNKSYQNHGSDAVNTQDWFRIQHSSLCSPKDHELTALALKEKEERRKFEWIVPEHLPTSPLCPLHPKYKGPCTGICYWHNNINNKTSSSSSSSSTISKKIGDETKGKRPIVERERSSETRGGVLSRIKAVDIGRLIPLAKVKDVPRGIKHKRLLNIPGS